MNARLITIAALLAVASGAVPAQDRAKDTAPAAQAVNTKLAPVTVEAPRVRLDDSFSPFVWDTIGAAGTIRADIVARWIASEKPEPVRTADAARR